MPDLRDFERLTGLENGLAVVTTLRGDQTMQASVVNARVLTRDASRAEKFGDAVEVMVADPSVSATLRAPFADVDKAFAFLHAAESPAAARHGQLGDPNSAVSARKGVSNWSVYTATKGALLSMARALAVELAPRGIRVNTVIPGPIDTPAVGELGLPPDQADVIAKNMASGVLLGRFGTGEEAARAVTFLASPAASYITGSEIAIDGGMAAA